MTPKQYLKESARTVAGGDVHTNLIAEDAFRGSLKAVLNEGKDIDQIKKALFYGKEPSREYLSPDFEGEARLDLEKLPEVDLVHAILGAVSESLELLELLLSGKEVETSKLEDEGGDLLWYLALMCRTRGISFESMMSKNIVKLKTRFPDKFDADLAINKDTSVEQAAVDAQ